MNTLSATIAKLGVALGLVFMSSGLAASGLQPSGRHFTQNRGQIIDTDGQLRPDVRFKMQGSGAEVYLTDRGISFVIVSQDRTEEPFADMEGEMAEKMRMLDAQTIQERMDMNLVGMRPDFEVVTAGQQTAVDHFYLAHCPDGVTFVPSFSDVTYKGVYPGIDWHMQVVDGQFKTEFIVHPGADPAQIRLQLTGQQALSILPDGSLRMQGQTGNVEDAAPQAFQGNTAVASQYSVDGSELGFVLGQYDPSKALVIDPYTRIYSTLFGSTANEWYLGHTTASDASGMIYLAGTTGGTNFPATVGAFQTSSMGGQDGFVAKFDNNGARQWATYYGGSAGEGGIAFKVGLCVDPSNNVWYSEVTSSTNFPVTAGCAQPTNGGGVDASLVKLSTTGTRLYATYFGGSGSESPSISRWGANSAPAIASDASGNIFMHGLTQSTNFPVTASCFQPGLAGGTDAFFAKFSNAGVKLYATFYGGSSNEEAAAVGIAVDNAGNAWMSGCTGSSNFPITAGSFQTTFAGVFDQYLVKWNNACVRQYATFYGGSGDEGVLCDVDVTPAGDVWMGVFVQSTNFPITAGAYQTASAGGWEFGAVRFSNAGARLYATYFGSGNQEEPWDISVDRTTGRVCIVGATWGSTMMTMGPPFTTASSGGQDGAILVLDANGFPIYSTYYGSSGHDEAFCSVFDPFGNLWVSGMAGAAGFPTTAGAFQTTFQGGSDPFLAKFTPPVILDNGQLQLAIESVEGNLVKLAWDNEEDASVRNYVLQRDLGGSWQDVAEVAADGRATYRHADQVPVEGLVRYRLRVDMRDGGTAYSPMVQAELAITKDLLLQAWPNPVAKGRDIHLLYQMAAAGKLEVRLSSIDGRLVSTTSHDLGFGRNHVELRTDGWASGTYLLQLSSPKGTEVHKIVIE